jgi:hypothetical protein
VLPVLALFGLAVAITAWLQHWAVQTHIWSNDEDLYRHVARAIARDFPFGVFDVEEVYGRGIQRVHLLALAAPMAFTQAPLAFELAHLLFVAGYVSAIVPAWLLARGVGLGRWAALVPAVLAVLVPWSVLTTSFLTESLGYGAFAWALFAIWRSAVRPSLAADAFALALLALAVLTRTGFLLLAPILPLAALLQAWRFGTSVGSARERLRAAPRAAFRRQPLAMGAGAAGVLALAGYWAGLFPAVRGQLIGTYSSGLPPLDEVVLKWRTFASQLVVGTGFVAAAAFPWVVVQVSRPRSPEAHALAVTAILATFAVLFALVNGPGDERYVMHAAFPLVVVGTTALLRADVSPAALALGGISVAALFLAAIWTLTDPTDFGYFAHPAETAMVRVVLARVSETAFAILLAGGVLAAAAAVRAAGVRPVLPLLVIPVAVWQLAMTEYTVRKYVTTAGSASAPGIGDRAFVDQNVPDGEEVGIWAVPAGEQGRYSHMWREVQYWNTAMRSVVVLHAPVSSVGSSDFPYPYGTNALAPSLDFATGRVRWSGQPPLPRYLAVARQPVGIALRWRKVAEAPQVPVDLVRVAHPVRAQWAVRGVTQDMAVPANGKAVVRVYREAAAGARCAYVDLVVPAAIDPARAKPVRYVASIDGQRLHRLTLQQQGRARMFFPLRFNPRRAALLIKIETRGNIRSPDGRPLALQIGAIALEGQPCRARIVS